MTTPCKQVPGVPLARSAWCIVGGGNMASAIVRGAVASGEIAADRFVIAEIDAEKRRAFTGLGARVSDSVSGATEQLLEIEVSPGAGHVLLAVKPQMFDSIVPALRAALAIQSRRVVSIMAGLKTDRLERALGSGARVLRVMPNTPARIRMGTAAWALGKSASEGDEAETVGLFSTLGITLALNEDLFDAFTAIAGSGPAYLFYLAEALARAGVSSGIDPEAADRIVRAVLAGSAELLRETANRSPAELRSEVTSKGGTTEAAIRTLDAAGVDRAIVAAIGAATRRGMELSRAADSN